MGSTIQVSVRESQGKTHVVKVDEGATVKELREKIAEILKVEDDQLRIHYAGKDIRPEGDRGKLLYLSDYGIEDNSTVMIIQRLKGGAKRLHPSVPKAGPNDEDMITLDTDGPRGRLPCGHVIGPDSLTDLCMKDLGARKHEIRCPECRQLLDIPILKKFAALTTDETKTVEIKLAENYMSKAPQIQPCPKCGSFCERRSSRDQRVICGFCTNAGVGLYEFCWFCLRKWNSSSIRGNCGNSGCSGVDPSLKVLKECAKKTVVGVENCPSIRACPKCGILIEHIEDQDGSISCKQMVCSCGQKFCFICLKMADKTGKYQCGDWNTKCEIAPIQKSLPGN